MKYDIKKIAILSAVALLSLSAAFLIVNRKQISVKNPPGQDMNKPVSKKEVASSEVASFIVPHHLVARDLIEEAFQSAVGKNVSQPARIILISPNHFNLGRGWVIGSDENWKTGSGEVFVDKQSLELLQAEKVINIEPEAFEREHGIRDIMPFIAEYYPQVPVVPLMVRDGMPNDLIVGFSKALTDKVSEKTLLILSSDFSHELDENISDFHDRKAIEALSSFDFESMKNMETDCLAGLEIISRYSQTKGYGKFNLISNSNSSVIYRKHFVGDNTSYVTGYYSKGVTSKIERTANLLFFGDLMLDRDVRTLIEKKGADYLTGGINRLFWAQDLNIANLEGPITNNQSVSAGTMETEPSHFKFTFDPQMAEDLLEKINIGAVSLGNNHILNFNATGLSQTKENLETSGIKYFGAPQEENGLAENINGKKIAFISYNQFDVGSLEKALSAIGEMKNKADVLIVYAHWGTEYELTENERQKKLAHQFIDVGADLIIGSHPHVVQPVEIYKGKAIYYSLGNFIFDQYFSEDVRERLALGVSISDNQFDFLLVPLYLEKNGMLVLMDEKRREKFLGRIAGNSNVEDNIKEKIREGKFTVKY